MMVLIVAPRGSLLPRLDDGARDTGKHTAGLPADYFLPTGS